MENVKNETLALVRADNRILRANVMALEDQLRAASKTSDALLMALAEAQESYIELENQSESYQDALLILVNGLTWILDILKIDSYSFPDIRAENRYLALLHFLAKFSDN